jgi:hypothetical protein
MCMANVAQLVRASGCGSEGRGFESHRSPQNINEDFVSSFLFWFIIISKHEHNNMDLNKHIVKNSNDSLFHSSGFAQVANGNRLGSDGDISFEKRQQIERNRRLIGSYQRSTIGQNRIKLPHRTVIKVVPARRQARPIRNHIVYVPVRRPYRSL